MELGLIASTIFVVAGAIWALRYVKHSHENDKRLYVDWLRTAAASISGCVVNEGIHDSDDLRVQEWDQFQIFDGFGVLCYCTAKLTVAGHEGILLVPYSKLGKFPTLVILMVRLQNRRQPRLQIFWDVGAVRFSLDEDIRIEDPRIRELLPDGAVYTTDKTAFETLLSGELSKNILCESRLHGLELLPQWAIFIGEEPSDAETFRNTYDAAVELVPLIRKAFD